MDKIKLIAATVVVVIAACLPWGDFAARAQAGDWKATGGFDAPEAKQAAAADDKFVYVVTNDRVAKYTREGQRVALSAGDAKHLNSAFVFNGKVYCAHSNYPQKPERSEIRVLDPKSMKLAVFHDFGNFGGSLTWAVREGDVWWCCFAHYGEDNRKTFLAKFDGEWRETARWTFPPEIFERIGKMSLSGGIWLEGALLVSDHDHGWLYELRVPESGGALEFVGEHGAPLSGQGFAYDPKTKELIGINRARKRVVFMRRAE